MKLVNKEDFYNVISPLDVVVNSNITTDINGHKLGVTKFELRDRTLIGTAITNYTTHDDCEYYLE